MLWRLLLCYEIACLSGMAIYFVVVLVKEVVHYVKTDDLRMARVQKYVEQRYGVRYDGFTKQDKIEVIIKVLLFGWYFGMLCLNEYYNFLEQDAEQNKGGT